MRKPDEEDTADAPNSETLTFSYRKVVPGGDPRVKGECLKQWQSNVDGTKCDNFEFLQVGKLDVEIPDNSILEPYIRIRVMEEPAAYMLLGKVGSPTLIGESLQSLGES